jgi:hypothetical protein
MQFLTVDLRHAMPAQARHRARICRWPRVGRQRRHRRPGVLLRPALALAAGQQREHERATAPVLPPAHRLQAVTQSDLDAVAAELNDRPRQTLEWKSPCQALDQALR